MKEWSRNSYTTSHTRKHWNCYRKRNAKSRRETFPVMAYSCTSRVHSPTRGEGKSECPKVTFSEAIQSSPAIRQSASPRMSARCGYRFSFEGKASRQISDFISRSIPFDRNICSWKQDTQTRRRHTRVHPFATKFRGKLAKENPATKRRKKKLIPTKRRYLLMLSPFFVLLSGL